MTSSVNLLYISDAAFESILTQAGDKPVLVDFFAERCGPCRMLSPIIEELANEYIGKAIIAKCDVDSNPNSAEKYGISSIPAVKIFKNSVIVREQVGVATKNVYSNAINQFIS